MKNEDRIKARKNEVGYCGAYCRTCCWYVGGSHWFGYPAKRLLSVLTDRSNWVTGFIDSKGGDAGGIIKMLETLSQSGCGSNCKGGSGWHGCPVRTCCINKNLDFCFQCSAFPCKMWDEKGDLANIFSTTKKKKRLLEIKKTGIEKWIGIQWKQ